MDRPRVDHTGRSPRPGDTTIQYPPNAGITGDVVLEDVRLQPGLLRHLLGPAKGGDYELARGTVRELRLTVPWARILAQSQPVLQATLRTVEIVVRRRARKGRDDDRPEEGEGEGGPAQAAATATAAAEEEDEGREDPGTAENDGSTNVSRAFSL